MYENEIGKRVTIKRKDDPNIYIGLIEESEEKFVRLLGIVNTMGTFLAEKIKLRKFRLKLKTKLNKENQIDLDEKIFQLFRKEFLIIDITRDSIEQMDILNNKKS